MISGQGKNLLLAIKRLHMTGNTVDSYIITSNIKFVYEMGEWLRKGIGITHSDQRPTAQYIKAKILTSGS